MVPNREERLNCGLADHWDVISTRLFWFRSKDPIKRNVDYLNAVNKRRLVAKLRNRGKNE